MLSQRGGDFLFESGQDLAVGYDRHDDEAVHLYLEESFSFRVATPEAAVAIAPARGRADGPGEPTPRTSASAGRSVAASEPHGTPGRAAPSRVINVRPSSTCQGVGDEAAAHSQDVDGAEVHRPALAPKIPVGAGERAVESQPGRDPVAGSDQLLDLARRSGTAARSFAPP